MIKNNIDSYLFHLALHEIAQGAHIHSDGKNLVIGNRDGSSMSSDQMAHVLGFIRGNAYYLKSEDNKVLDSLESRLSFTAPKNIRQDIHSLFQWLHKYDANKVESKLPECPASLHTDCVYLDIRHSANLMHSELFQLLKYPQLVLTSDLSTAYEVPDNWDASEIVSHLRNVRAELGSHSSELCEVIDQLIEKHEDPHFVLLTKMTHALGDPSLTVTEDLNVVRGKPAGWNITKVVDSLQKVKSHISPTQQPLIEVLDRLIEEHQPPKLVKLGFCIEQTEDGDSSGVVRMGMNRWLKSGMAVLTTKALISGQNKVPLNCNIYVQKEGGLALCVPHDIQIDDLGMNLTEFNALVDNPVEREVFDPQNDLRKVLAKSDKNTKIHRLMVVIGHGSDQKICGLPVNEFQETLDVLSENGLTFMCVYSCYSGGKNVSHIRTSDGRIPCPILVMNATESAVMVSGLRLSRMKKLLDATGSKLFSPLPSGRTPKLSHSMRQSSFRDLGKSQITQHHELNIVQELFEIHNLQTLLLPTNRADIPRITYKGASHKRIVDLDSAIRKELRINLTSLQKKVQININSDEVNVLFCSAPYLPAVITVNGTTAESRIGIIARGGNSTHFIDELRIPGSTLEEFVLASANKIKQIASGTPLRLTGANKFFFIGKLQCKDDSENLCNFYNVSLSLTNTNPEISYFDSNGKYYLRGVTLKLRENIVKDSVCSTKIEAASRVRPAIEIDNELEISFRCFDNYLQCKPNKEHLMATTSGRHTSNDLCNELANRLKNRINPEYVDLFILAMQPQSVNTLMEKLEGLSKELQATAVDYLLRIAVTSDNEKAVGALFHTFGPWEQPLIDGKFALHLAAEKGSGSVMKTLISKVKNFDVKDDKGRTPLHYAAIENHSEIVDILLDYYVDKELDNVKLTALDYAILNNQKATIKKLLNQGETQLKSTSTLIQLPELCLNPSMMQAVISSKRIPLTERVFVFKKRKITFLEYFLVVFKNLPEAAPSLKLLMDAKCADDVLFDREGRNLVMILLKEGEHINKDNLRELLKRFPPITKDDWKLIHLESIHSNFKCIDLDLNIDWKKLGKLAYEIDNSFEFVMNLVDQYHPDLSKDDNWKSIYNKFLYEGQMNHIQTLKKCGIIPEIPEEMGKLSSDQLLTWLQEAPINIPKFIHTLEGGFKLNQDTSVAESSLITLLIWNFSLTSDQYNKKPQIQASIQKLLEMGTKFDPTKTPIPAWILKKHHVTPINVLTEACNSIPGFKDEPAFVKLINDELQKGNYCIDDIKKLISQNISIDYELLKSSINQKLLGSSFRYYYNKIGSYLYLPVQTSSLTINEIKFLHSQRIPFDYKLLTEDQLVEIIENDNDIDRMLASGATVSEKMVSKVLSLWVDDQHNLFNHLLPKLLGNFEIAKKEKLLGQARDMLIQKVKLLSVIPDSVLPKFNTLIQLGSSLDITPDFLALFNILNCQPLLELTMVNIPKQLQGPELQKHLTQLPVNLLNSLIMTEALDPNDLALLKLPKQKLAQLECARYEKGVRPSPDVSLTRYWVSSNDPLQEVILRDLQPDPKSDIARRAIVEAFKRGNWMSVKRLLDLGVYCGFTNTVVEPLKINFDRFFRNADQYQILNELLKQGLDPNLFRDIIKKQTVKMLFDSYKFHFDNTNWLNFIKLVQPINWECPDPTLSHFLKLGNINCPNILKFLSELGYDTSLHSEDIAKWIVATLDSNNGIKDSQIESMIKFSPSIIQTNLLPIWLNPKLSINILHQIEKRGADPKLLEAYIQAQFPEILGKIKSPADINFLKRYIETEKWIQENCIPILKSLLDKASYETLTQLFPLISDIKSLTDNLSKRYSTADIDIIKLLLNAKIPITKSNKKSVHKTLVEYDELKLLKLLTELL